VLEVGAEVCGRWPVRTIGGWSRVEIAINPISHWHGAHDNEYIPFCPDSLTECVQLLLVVSNAPPIEVIELAVEPRRDGNLPLEPGRSDASYRGKE
jgi:hypothetical protein